MQAVENRVNAGRGKQDQCRPWKTGSMQAVENRVSAGRGNRVNAGRENRFNAGCGKQGECRPWEQGQSVGTGSMQAVGLGSIRGNRVNAGRGNRVNAGRGKQGQCRPWETGSMRSATSFKCANSMSSPCSIGTKFHITAGKRKAYNTYPPAKRHHDDSPVWI